MTDANIIRRQSYESFEIWRWKPLSVVHKVRYGVRSLDTVSAQGICNKNCAVLKLIESLFIEHVE